MRGANLLDSELGCMQREYDEDDNQLFDPLLCLSCDEDDEDDDDFDARLQFEKVDDDDDEEEYDEYYGEWTEVVLPACAFSDNVPVSVDELAPICTSAACGCKSEPVSYTHLTLPTNREV